MHSCRQSAVTESLQGARMSACSEYQQVYRAEQEECPGGKGCCQPKLGQLKILHMFGITLSCSKTDCGRVKAGSGHCREV